ncbi:metallophosphoesterase (plasmid) [Niallia taxi]|uniref:metallophosphoesterase n=1 Tax=Niallia taxi TaxID=2499688 RepID=UPI003F5EF22D
MKRIKFIWIIIGALIIFILGTIWSNSHVTVDKVTLTHNRLPTAFDNYKILQISDLQGKEFGSNQKRLVKLIKKQQYDLVVFTGDYISEENEDLQPLENLLKGMPKNKGMYYILGDRDADNSTAALKKGDRFYDLFTKYNVKPLYPGMEIKKGNESIWLKTNPYVGLNEVGGSEISSQLIQEKEEFEAHYKEQQDPFTIEISHRPTEIDSENPDLHDYRKTALNDTGEEWRHWDVSLNGHTLGGQFRLPLLGPLYAPNFGLFPGKVNVTGVHTIDNHTQYVNNGLGVSGPLFMKFRLFNTPSIGLITLKTK